ncbi:cell wall hydrolase [Phenylobacterium sp.]|uniref:cell wall hydrolase n=1 Tax=Phenylobacterium sp. TaxID=1871053 RepID=UPI003BAC3C40
MLLGSGVGLALGAAYLAGGMARATTDHQRAARLAEAAAGGFSESVLQREAAAMDPGVLRVARRHDPFTVAGGAERDRQTAILTARLEQRDRSPASALVLRAAFAGPLAPAAAPFRMAGVMESSRELECLTQAVYFEARGEAATGQQAVAQVVLNRVRHPAYPKSVCGVVFQGAARARGCQFSFACDGSMRRGREAIAWNRAKQVAARALSGAVMASVGDATNFHTTGVSPNWGGRMIRVAQVGTHVFYRFGRGAAPATYVADSRAAGRDLNEAPVAYASLAPTPAASSVASAPDFRLASAVVVSGPADSPLVKASEAAEAPPPASDAKAKAEAPKAKPASAPAAKPAETAMKTSSSAASS